MSAAQSIGDPVDHVARGVLDSLIEGCQVIGFDWKYMYVNDTVAAQGRKSREQLIGHTMMECYPGIEMTPMFAALQRCMQQRKHERLENEFEFPDGSKGWFELRFIPVPEGTCVLSLDITESKRTQIALAKSEEQLRHAQKMDAVGRLAGGVAHDFNNLLSVILSYSTFLDEALPPDDPLREDVDEIRKASQRGAALTKQLTAVSRQQVAEPQVLNLNDVVKGLDAMLARLVGEGVELKTITDRNIGRVIADPDQMGQVLMNLIVNARDAMPKGGKVTIETKDVQLDSTYAREHLGVTPGRYVMLAVSDTGEGMDKQTQQRLFEPFFTTKEKGKGTGLGLSIVFGIVQQSGGSIWVYSEIGEGTTFKIYLPCTGERVRSSLAPVRVSSVRGTETILLVEDDEQLRTVAQGILTRNGYIVMVARSGNEALSLCTEHQGAIQLLLTDVIMPQLGGRELAEQISAISPGIKVLFMSGYTEDAILHHRVLEPGIALLQKPITPESLSRKVREILDTPCFA
jgi:signal transduction histidine kinase